MKYETSELYVMADALNDGKGRPKYDVSTAKVIAAGAEGNENGKVEKYVFSFDNLLVEVGDLQTDEGKLAVINQFIEDHGELALDKLADELTTDFRLSYNKQKRESVAIRYAREATLTPAQKLAQDFATAVQWFNDNGRIAEVMPILSDQTKVVELWNASK